MGPDQIAVFVALLLRKNQVRETCELVAKMISGESRLCCGKSDTV